MTLTPEQQAADEATPPDVLRELAKLNLTLARVVAQNANADANLLQELASIFDPLIRFDPVIRQNLAMNPNTPVPVLAELAKQLPRHLFKNPAIDLLLLENPNLLANSANMLCGLVKRSIASLRMLEYAANSIDERLQLAVIMNAQTPKSMLARLVQSQNPRISGAAQMHVNWANQEDADWQAIAEAALDRTCEQVFGQTFDPALLSSHDLLEALMQLLTIRELAAQIPEKFMRSIRWDEIHTQPIHKAELEELAQSTQWKLEKVGKNRHTPAHLLEQVVELGDWIALKAVASNPNTPVYLLEKLVADHQNDEDMLWTVATNPKTPLFLLEQLAGHPSHQKVSSAVACNPNTSIRILEELIDLAEHPPTFCWECVLRAVAKSPKLSADTFEKLANYPDASLRTIIANNPFAPRSLVMRLLEEFEREGGYNLLGYIDIAEIIATNPHLSANFLSKLLSQALAGFKQSWHDEPKKQYEHAVSVIARHPNLSPATLRFLLLEQDYPPFCRAAATNPRTPEYIEQQWGLDTLSTIPDYLLEIIAANLYASDRLLLQLVTHPDRSIHTVAARNPAATEQVLAPWETARSYWVGDLEQHLGAEQQMLDRWEASISVTNRLVILLHHQTPNGLLAHLARSSSWLERYAIAKHPNTPLPILQRLTTDGNWAVRAAAQTHLASRS